MTFEKSPMMLQSLLKSQHGSGASAVEARLAGDLLPD